jgi:hypothetical protein
VQRIEITVRICGDPDTEVDVRSGELGRAARADRRHFIPLGHLRTLGDENRPEMCQGDGVPVPGLDGDRLAARRHRPREADRACRRRQDCFSRGVGTDVDAAMLTRCVRVRLVVDKRLHHRPLHRPAPRMCGGRPHQEDHADQKSPRNGCCQPEQHTEQRSAIRRSLSTLLTATACRAGFAGCPQGSRRSRQRVSAARPLPRAQ